MSIVDDRVLIGRWLVMFGVRVFCWFQHTISKRGMLSMSCGERTYFANLSFFVLPEKDLHLALEGRVMGTRGEYRRLVCSCSTETCRILMLTPTVHAVVYMRCFVVYATRTELAARYDSIPRSSP